jgi:MoaA/NifB/PqqE/SkfB family radical SAM enzyme
MFPDPAANSGLVRQALRWLSGGRRQEQALYPLLSQLEATIRSRPKSAELSDALEAAKTDLLRSLESTFGVTAAKAIAIKLLNLCLAKNHFQARDTVLLSRPIALVFDPSNSCNLACPGCVHSTQAKEKKWFDWQPGNLNAARLATFLDRYGPTAISVTLCNYGEPLVNPETPKFIRSAKLHLMRTLLTTNISLPRFDPDAYVESGLDQMVLSIDGATQAVYERFRRKGSLELVLENVRKLVEAKRKSGRMTPVITWRFLGFQHNVHEAQAACDLAKQMGVDQFVGAPAWEVDWDDPEIRPAPMQPFQVEFGLDVYKATARNWNPFPDSLDAAAIDREFHARFDPVEEAAKETRGSTCEWLYKNITMDAGGRIFPCCCSPRPGAELTFTTLSPGPDSATGAEIYNGDMFQKARRFFADPQAYRREAVPDAHHPFCVKCPWDKTAMPDAADMRNYFAALSPRIFDPASLNLLSSW